MFSKWFLVAAACASCIANALAAPDVLVEGVNMPAWVTRGGLKRPLGAGETLQAADEITTATGSRVLLRLGDGSAVKLGENARFVVAAAAPAAQNRFLFQATLQVLTGAFRFTTAAVAKVRAQRDVTIQLPTVTVGIRGTDLWGKAQTDREFVVLIEGRIAVKRGDGAQVEMTEPLSVFDAPKDAPTSPPGKATLDVLSKYAAETEISSGTGAARAGGKWKVTVGTFGNQEDALGTYDSLRAAGYPAVIRPVTSETGTIYRVRILGLPSRAEAHALGRRLKVEMDVSEPSVSM
jgi:cell division septation protein DedD